MNNKKNYYREISVYEMFLYVLSKWKLVVTVFLVGCLIGGLYSVYLSNRDISEDVTIEQLKTLMTSEEEQNVKDAAEIINNYRIKYASQKEYNENSIFQNLNSNAINCMTLEYFIDNNYVVTYPNISTVNDLVPILKAYVSSLGESEIYVKMQKQINEKIQPSYYAEVVNIDTEFQDDGVFTIEIYGYDSSMVEKMSKIVEEYITNEHNEISSAYSDHEIILMSKNASVKVDNEVYEQQQFNIAYLTDITSAISKLEMTFSGNQLIYLKKLIHEELIEDVSVPKNIAIFGMAFFVIVVLVIALQYVLASKLKSVSEFEKINGTSVFGVICEKKENKKSSIGNVSNEEMIDIITTKINLIAEKEELNHICILTMCDELSEESEMIKSVMSKISSNIEVSVVKKVLYNHLAIEKVCSVGNVVLFEKLNSSKYSEIVKEIEFCEKYDVNILGSILAE